MWSFVFAVVFRVVIFSLACLRRSVIAFCVIFFLSVVRPMVASGPAIRAISSSVAVGLGMFWSRVMANTVWNVWFLKGVWSASA